jgi:hypothetical protein
MGGILKRRMTNQPVPADSGPRTPTRGRFRAHPITVQWSIRDLFERQRVAIGALIGLQQVQPYTPYFKLANEIDRYGFNPKFWVPFLIVPISAGDVLRSTVRVDKKTHCFAYEDADLENTNPLQPGFYLATDIHICDDPQAYESGPPVTDSRSSDSLVCEPCFREATCLEKRFIECFFHSGVEHRSPFDAEYGLPEANCHKKVVVGNRYQIWREIAEKTEPKP